MKILIPCDSCLQLFEKDEKHITEHNYCCQRCRCQAMSKFNKHMNPVNRPSCWTDERREQSRERNLGKGNDKAYRKYYGRHLHRILAEQKIGRKLTKNEVVHHVNGDPLDNRLENIEVMTRAEHTSLHSKNWWKSHKGGDANDIQQGK